MLVIKINSKKSKYNQISLILGVIATSQLNCWEYEVEDNSILKIHEILHDKFLFLSDIGVRNNDITIWLYYEYEEQCNLEFTTKELALLSNLNTDFCISCWKK